jgi:V/A-type H+-transporting ATPase subunit A
MDNLSPWFDENVDPCYSTLRSQALSLLQDESELEEIVRLVGVDALSVYDRLKLESARSVREDYLQQDAFNDIDMYASQTKQFLILSAVLRFYDLALKALERGADFSAIERLAVRERIARMKFLPENEIEQGFADIMSELNRETDCLTQSKTEN